MPGQVSVQSDDGPYTLISMQVQPPFWSLQSHTACKRAGSSFDIVSVYSLANIRYLPTYNTSFHDADCALYGFVIK